MNGEHRTGRQCVFVRHKHGLIGRLVHVIGRVALTDLPLGISEVLGCPPKHSRPGCWYYCTYLEEVGASVLSRQAGEQVLVYINGLNAIAPHFIAISSFSPDSLFRSCP